MDNKEVDNEPVANTDSQRKSEDEAVGEGFEEDGKSEIDFSILEGSDQAQAPVQPVYQIRPPLSEKFKPMSAKEVIHDVLFDQLSMKVYDEKEARGWCQEIADIIRVKVKGVMYTLVCSIFKKPSRSVDFDFKVNFTKEEELPQKILSNASINICTSKYDTSQTQSSMPTLFRDLNFKRYKYIVNVVMGEHRGAGVKMGTRCIWDAEADSYAHDNFFNESIFCVATIYAVYHY